MSKYVCIESRRIADDVYLVGDTYEIADDVAARYSGYFAAVQQEAVKVAPVTRAPKPPAAE